MEITICPGKAPRRAAVPLSKSEGHRALILSAMAQGETLLPRLPASGDLLATMDCLRQMGAALTEREKMAILQDGFRQLEEDRKKFEQERQTLLKEARERQSVEQEPGEGSFTAVQLLFRGVNNPLALRKRYRDLIKIFHPDNLFGDGELAGQINKEYLKRKQEERFW